MRANRAGLTPLQVAIAAGVLLVALVGVDVVFNSTARLDVREGESWETVATIPEDRDRFAQPSPTIEVNRSEEVTFRVVLDNDRPLGFDEPYSVRIQGQTVDEGRITVGGMASDETRFRVPAENLLGTGPAKAEPQPPRSFGASVEFLVGDDTTFTHLEVQEVAR